MKASCKLRMPSPYKERGYYQGAESLKIVVAIF